MFITQRSSSLKVTVCSSDWGKTMSVTPGFMWLFTGRRDWSAKSELEEASTTNRQTTRKTRASDRRSTGSKRNSGLQANYRRWKFRYTEGAQEIKKKKKKKNKRNWPGTVDRWSPRKTQGYRQPRHRRWEKPRTAYRQSTGKTQGYEQP